MILCKLGVGSETCLKVINTDTGESSFHVQKNFPILAELQFSPTKETVWPVVVFSIQLALWVWLLTVVCCMFSVSVLFVFRDGVSSNPGQPWTCDFLLQTPEMSHAAQLFNHLSNTIQYLLFEFLNAHIRNYKERRRYTYVFYLETYLNSHTT